MIHRTNIITTRDRTWLVKCTCGWQSGDNDSAGEANQAADEHEIKAALNEAQHNLPLPEKNHG